MDPIELLLFEHRQIFRMLDRLEAECDRVRTGGVMNPVFFRRVADFLSQYVDNSHHEKEAALFKALAPYGLSSAPAAVKKIVDEHEVSLQVASEVGRLADEVQGGLASPEQLMSAALDYARRFREHALEEERTVFPLARRLLVPAARDLLRSRVARIEAANPAIAEAVQVFERAFPPPPELRQGTR